MAAVFAFVVWSNVPQPEADEIVADIRNRFTLLDDEEAARDLFLITGRERASFDDSFDARDPRPVEADLLGTRGWDDERQLLRALELAGGCRRIAGHGLALEVGD